MLLERLPVFIRSSYERLISPAQIGHHLCLSGDAATTSECVRDIELLGNSSELLNALSANQPVCQTRRRQLNNGWPGTRAFQPLLRRITGITSHEGDLMPARRDRLGGKPATHPRALRTGKRAPGARGITRGG